DHRSSSKSSSSSSPSQTSSARIKSDHRVLTPPTAPAPSPPKKSTTPTCVTTTNHCTRIEGENHLDHQSTASSSLSYVSSSTNNRQHRHRLGTVDFCPEESQQQLLIGPIEPPSQFRPTETDDQNVLLVQPQPLPHQQQNSF